MQGPYSTGSVHHPAIALYTTVLCACSAGRGDVVVHHNKGMLRVTLTPHTRCLRSMLQVDLSCALRKLPPLGALVYEDIHWPSLKRLTSRSGHC